jgi:hypothetical protein
LCGIGEFSFSVPILGREKEALFFEIKVDDDGISLLVGLLKSHFDFGGKSGGRCSIPWRGRGLESVPTGVLNRFVVLEEDRVVRVDEW